MSTIPQEALAAAHPRTEKAGELRIQPLNLQQILALAAIDHPIMRQNLDSKGKPVPQRLTMEEQLLVVAVMAMDPNDLARILAEGVEKAELKRAAYLAAAQVPIDALEKLLDGVRAQMERGVSTFVPMRADGDGAAGPLPRT